MDSAKSNDGERRRGGAESSIDQLQTDLEDAGAESVYLLVMEGCEFCAAMKNALSDHIEQGVVDVIDIENDDKALDIIETMDESPGAPSLIVETDEGEYIAYG